MTPKEKAKQLFRKFYILDHKIWQDTAKQCAIIAVDELIEQERKTDDYYEIGSYWNEVKQEINNL